MRGDAGQFGSFAACRVQRTTSELSDIATAAIKGVTRPASASGTAILEHPAEPAWLDDGQRDALSNVLEECRFGPKETICREGDVADALFLVRDAKDPRGDGALEPWHDAFAAGRGGAEKALGTERCVVVRVGGDADNGAAESARAPTGALAGARVVRGSLHAAAAIEALVAETRAALDGVLAEVTRDRR